MHLSTVFLLLLPTLSQQTSLQGYSSTRAVKENLRNMQLEEKTVSN